MGAALGNSSLENTAQAMIATMASQIKGVKGSADAMGQLNDIVGVGDMRMEQLAQAMATGLLPSAANAGLSLKDVGAALATVTDNATPANVTATRLRMTIALMASPSKAAATALGEIGLSGTSLASDMRQPNGLLKAVEDLKTHLRDSGKSAVEQDAILTKAFGGGRSSAVIQTLIAETDRLRNKYDQLGASNGPAKLAKSWAEYQKSQSASFSELKSGAEAFAITVGNVVLPELSKLAGEATHALDGFIKSGGAKQAGEDLVHIFDELGTVIGNVAGPLLGVAQAMIAVGKAAGLGNATELTALVAAVVAFEGATFVAPILMAIAGGIAEIGVAAYTAESVAAFGGDLVALAGGPMGAVIVALSAVAGLFAAFGSDIFSSTSAAEKNAEAMKADSAAIEGLNTAVTEAATAHFAAERAVLAHQAALKHLADVRHEITTGQLKGKAATEAEKEALLETAETANRVTAAHEQEVASLNNKTKAAAKSRDTIDKERKATEDAIKVEEREGSKHRGVRLAGEEVAREEKLARLRALRNKQLEETAQKTAEIQVNDESLARIENNRSAITPGNARGVAHLQDALRSAGASQTVTTRYELEDQGAQAKLGNLSAALTQLGQRTVVANVLTTAPNATVAVLALQAVLRGVPGSKVIQIMHNARSTSEAMVALRAATLGVPASKVISIESNANSEAQKIAELKGLIEGLPNKTVTITTALKTVGDAAVKGLGGFASGRGAGGGEAALVGEGSGPEYVVNASTGQGMRVEGPMLMGLGPQDYVVPTEDRYRGRALGLFAALARDLHIPGYRAGRHRRNIPGVLDPLSVPVADLEQKASGAKTAYDSATSHLKTLGKHATARDRQAVATAREKMRNLEREAGDAKAFAAKVTHDESLANQGATAMRLADARGDNAAYDKAKAGRDKALGDLRGLIVRQAGHAHGAFLDQLREHLGSVELEKVTTEQEGTVEPGALTPAQLLEEKRLEASQALAALTPGLGDDTVAAQALVGFFTNALGAAQVAGAGPGTIIELAGQLKSARQNLESLATPASGASGATNENADVQAQITQANEGRELEARRANIAEQAFAVLNGSGDIGQGGRNATGAVVNVYTLHPGDPQTLSAIGAAATAGIGLQGHVQRTREQVGP